VRKAADAAVAALVEAEEQVKAGWSDELRKAYREVEAAASANGNARARRQYDKAVEAARDVDDATKAAAGRVKEADDAAETARLDAEATFDEAERCLSAGMAREGAQKAIDSWELRERAIRRAEAAARR
jgi:hypothetical protein